MESGLMGIFDSVWVPCPQCGKKQEFQSKAGDPYMNHFTMDTAPAVVLAELNGASATCECGTTFTILTSVQATVRVTT